MRNLIAALILVGVGFSFAQAAPAYSTAMPKKHAFSARLESYTIFDRDLENDYGELKSQQQFFGLTYGIFDWLCLDLKAGGGDIRYRSLSDEKINYDSGFAGGYGLRYKFVDKEKIKGVLGFEHISVHPHATDQGEVKHEAILDDWQVALVGSYMIGKFTPYLGVRWSRVDYIHKQNDSRKRVMSDLDKSTGLIAGIDIPLNEKLYINVEGNFLDSQALAVSLNYNF
jgi:hypothetical protein